MQVLVGDVPGPSARRESEKKNTFYSSIYTHWLEHKPAEADSRSEIAIVARWKKLLPEVTKFSGLHSKLKRRERSGWNEDMYVKSTMEVYADRHKKEFEVLSAWETLKDTPKWTRESTCCVLV